MLRSNEIFNKVVFLVVFGCIFLGALNYSCFAKADLILYTNEFETDKTAYYNDESIVITANWHMDYGIGEFAYVQVRIYNSSVAEINDYIWASEQNSTEGDLTKTWIIPIFNLDLDFIDGTILLYIKFYYRYVPISGDWIDGFQDETTITTSKRVARCELIGFVNLIEFGQNLNFTVRMYDPNLPLTTLLINQNISLNISSDIKPTFFKIFVTNNSGEFKVSIKSENVSLGQNILVFKIIKNVYYNASDYLFYLTVSEVLGILPSSSNSDKRDKVPPSKVNYGLLTIIFVIISCMFFSLLIYRYNKNKQRDLSDLKVKEIYSIDSGNASEKGIVSSVTLDNDED